MTSTPPDLSLTLVRTLDAPPELVYEAWTIGRARATLVVPAPGRQGLRLHRVHDGLPGGRRVSLLHPLARRPGDLGARRLSRDRRLPATLQFTFQWEWAPQPSDETLITVTFEPQGRAGTRLMFTPGAVRVRADARRPRSGGWGAVLDRLAEDGRAHDRHARSCAMIRTFAGSCHCGAVRFRCDIDLAQPTSRCNCSICTKTRLWKTMAQPGSFQLLQGDDAVATYRFAGRARRAPFLHALRRQAGRPWRERAGTSRKTSTSSASPASTTWPMT